MALTSPGNLQAESKLGKSLSCLRRRISRGPTHGVANTVLEEDDPYRGQNTEYAEVKGPCSIFQGAKPETRSLLGTWGHTPPPCLCSMIPPSSFSFPSPSFPLVGGFCPHDSVCISSNFTEAHDVGLDATAVRSICFASAAQRRGAFPWE